MFKRFEIRVSTVEYRSGFRRGQYLCKNYDYEFESIQRVKKKKKDFKYNRNTTDKK